MSMSLVNHAVYKGTINFNAVTLDSLITTCTICYIKRYNKVSRTATVTGEIQQKLSMSQIKMFHKNLPHPGRFHHECSVLFELVTRDAASVFNFYVHVTLYFGELLIILTSYLQ